MRFTVEAAKLSGALSLARSVIDKRHTIPILEHALLELAGDTLSIRSTNMDQSLRTSLAVTGAENGSACLPGHRLAEIAAAMPKGAQIEIQSDKDGRFKVRCGRSLYALSGLPPDDEPVFPEVKGGTHGSLTVAALSRIVRMTKHAVCQDHRDYLSGIHLSTVKGLLRATSCDGHRIARVDTALPNGFRPSGLVAREIIDPLLKLLAASDGEDVVELQMSDRLLSVQIGKATLVTKLVDATFPDMERLFPKDTPITLTTDSEEFAAAIRRVSLVADDTKTRALRLKVGEGSLQIETAAAGGANGSEEISPVETDGGEIQIGFQSRYLLDVLALSSDTVTFSMSPDPAAPITARLGGDAAAIFLLVPFRV